MSNISNLAAKATGTSQTSITKSTKEKGYETALMSTKSTENASFLPSLPKEQQDEILALAPKVVDSFLEDKNVLIDFGKDAVEEVNKAVNMILHEQRNLDIPQVDDILGNANKELNGFVAKYKDITPAELDRKPNLFEKLFRKGKATIQELNYDSKNVEGKLDSMASTLVKNEEVLARNVVTAEMLIEENNKSIENLVQVIGFLEAAQVEAAKRASALKEEVDKLDTNTAEFNNLQTELTNVTDTVNMIEQQHTEYVGRLYVAWATTPQMRNLQKVSVDMKQKLKFLRANTIPTMKLSLAQLGLLQQSVRAGATAGAIVNANNAALQLLAETAAGSIGMIADVTQTPTISLESVTALAESLVKQNDGIIKAIEDGRRKRMEIESAVINSAETINNSTKIRDQKIIETIMTQAQDIERRRKEVDSTVIDGEVVSEQ